MDIKAILRWGKIAIGLFLFNLLLSLSMVGILLWSLFRPAKQIDRSEIHLRRAGIYSANGLWKSAAIEYQRAGENSQGEKAINFWLKAGDICYEKLEDYSCAVESYLNAKMLGKDFAKDSEIATRLVDALKQLGKTDSANALLNELTSLVPQPSTGSTVVARIGERQISLEELRKALANEPEAVQKEFAGKEGLRKYLNQYLLTKLLYQSALEENLIEEKSRQELERLKERYFAEIYFRKKILSSAKVSEQELKDYYAQHQSEFKDSSGGIKTLEEVKKEIETRLLQQKIKELQENWFKEQVEKRGIYINAQAFGAE